MPQARKEAIWRMYEDNMRESLTKSSFGWDPTSKKAEIFHKNSRFLVCTVSDSGTGPSAPLGEQLSGFACFRFEGDADLEGRIREVLYCYELQVALAFQGRGYGSRLLEVMQKIGRRWSMECILLTVLKDNAKALHFYDQKGFKVDETSPEPIEEMDYEIMALVL